MVDISRRNFIGGAAAFLCAGGCRTAGLFGGKPQIRFGVVSDIHLTTPESAALFERTLRYFDSRGVDAVVVPGDLSDWGLKSGIRYAADDDSMGVVLVFNGNVIAGTRAKKTYAHSYNAFSSVNFPALAVIRDRRIIRFISQLPFTEPVRFGHRLDDSIVVLKLIPGTRPELVEYLFAHYDCLVIESFGVGGIPDNLREVFYQQMEHWISRGKIVVIATQVANEGSNMEVYEVGQQVKQDFHLMEAYDMTLEATITKLMYLMGTYGGDYVSVCDGFYKTINYDILMPSMQQR